MTGPDGPAAASPHRVAVVGTGVIGAGWAALFLARGLDVVAFDPAPKAHQRLRMAVADAWPALTRLGLADGADPARLRFADSVTEAVADVRRLVQGLRPPALDDLGLLAALDQQAERLSTSDLAVSVGAEEVGPLSAAVEVAAYRIASEALANAARHAGARHAEVRLVGSRHDLLVEVSDDGTGIDADVVAGVGLRSIRERAEELGGRSEITCPAGGGTRVRAWLPVTPTTLEVS